MYQTFVLSLLFLLLTNCVQAQDRPNVILIFCDDMGYGDLGCYGNVRHRTPNIDRLAAEGVKLTGFYTAQAVCSASRAALMTGCYPNRIGILGALGPKATHGISNEETTIAELLRGQGYRTACFGKWHLGHHQRFLPMQHGFDTYYGLPYSNDMWPGHPNPKADYPKLPLIDGNQTIAQNPDQTRLTTDYTLRAVQFIKEAHASPFFLYLPHSMPHVPLHVSKERSGKSAAGLYGDVIEEIDWSVGQILQTLKQLNLDNKTLVIFTSDNGPWLSYGNHGGSATGLREGKGTSFDGGVRVPCLVRWPGTIPPGLVCSEPAMTIDMLPTLAHLSQAKLPKLKIDGMNIWTLLTQPSAKSPHDALYFYWGKDLHAVRCGKWKLHLPHPYQSLKAAPGKDGKPGPYEQKQLPLSLFDLQSDPAETSNLADANPEQVKLMMSHVAKARSDLGDGLVKQEATGARPAGR